MKWINCHNGWAHPSLSAFLSQSSFFVLVFLFMSCVRHLTRALLFTSCWQNHFYLDPIFTPTCDFTCFFNIFAQLLCSITSSFTFFFFWLPLCSISLWRFCFIFLSFFDFSPLPPPSSVSLSLPLLSCLLLFNYIHPHLPPSFSPRV